MGDIPTHKAIFEAAVRPALEEARPGEDYLCVRLGNYLTDVSQVRDTLAYAMAKMRIWEEAKNRSWLLRVPILSGILASIFEIPGYIEELLGRSTRVEDAALARYLDFFVRAFTIEAFAGNDGLPEQEVLRIYSRNFTRYYPHEHLDFPPWPYTDPVGDRDIEASPRMLRSLAEQMEYLIQALTAVEHAWTLSLDQGAKSPARHNALADLGHVLHSVEDFYFHTNFLEIAQLTRSSRQFTEPDSLHARPFWIWFKDHALDESPAEDSVRYRRRYFRRLQTPVTGDDKHALSTTTSLPAFSYLSTGGFGATDVFHTLYGALLGLNITSPELIKQLKRIVIVKDLLFEDERKALANDTHFNQELRAHKQQLDDPDFDRKIDDAVRLGLIRPSAAKAVKDAVALDRQVTRRYPNAPGIGGFLLSIAKLLQHEHDDSEALSQNFDQQNLVLDGRSEYCESTPSGRRCASAETIGTHSLLAKDTERSLPFRRDAMTYASFVSGFFARSLARHVGSAEDLDWRPVVSHFLRYPHVDDASWESQLLRAGNTPTGTLAYDELVDRPNLGPMTSRNLAVLYHMQPAKSTLASRYDAEAEAATSAWHNR